MTDKIKDTEKNAKKTYEQCPNCGERMDLNPESGRLICAFCNYEEQTEAAESKPQKAKELNFEDVAAAESCGWQKEYKSLKCGACKTELICLSDQIPRTCPYCGSDQIREENNTQTLAPRICEFELTAKQAEEKFKSRNKNNWLYPSEIQKHLKAEAFKAVYFPYWIFDVNTFSKYQAEYGLTRTETDDDGNTKTITDWYQTDGCYQEFIENQPIYASKRYDKKIIKALEPFNAGKSKEFKPEYLNERAAERYQITLKESWETAISDIKRKLEKSIDARIRNKNKADSARCIMFTTEYYDLKYQYLLLPVWISSFKYKDQDYSVIINGQTGQVYGKAPELKSKTALLTAAIILVLLIAFFLFK